LVYAGNADFMCSFIGNEAWVEALESPFKEEFSRSQGLPWTPWGAVGAAGRVRTAGNGAGIETAGNLTFIEIFEAGHMVPMDQGLAALDMIQHWLANEPFTGEL